MSLLALEIDQFRLLSAVKLTPASSLNIICGENGSGKTSLLEAIHYLSCAKSFRTTASTDLINIRAQKFFIYTEFKHFEQLMRFGTERYQNGMYKARLNESHLIHTATITAHLPVKVINSQAQQLFEAGPSFRRKFLDWGLFYHDEQFYSCWQHYERILKQRNAALKANRCEKEVTSWSTQLIEWGTQLDQFRRNYLNALMPFLNEYLLQLLPGINIHFQYQKGWRSHDDFSTALNESLREDFRFGYTSCGPHRADLEITHHGLEVRHFLSRGQQKLLICAMILAQGKLLWHHSNKSLIYLVDDLPAELDMTGRKLLINLLSTQKSQVFITAISEHSIAHLLTESLFPIKLFHVEQGEVKEQKV